MKTFIKLSSLLFLTVMLNAAVPQDGLKAEMDGRWNDAVNIYVKILQKTPQRSELYLRLADIYSSQKKLDKAANALKKAISIEPNNALFYKKLSEVYAVQDKPNEALTAITSALKLEEKNTKYLIAHAKIANWVKKFPDAIKSLKKVLKIDPKNREARLLLARSYEWSGESNNALNYYREYLKENPNDLHARLDLADIQVFFKDIEGANKTLEEGLKTIDSSRTSTKALQNIAAVDIPILLYHCVDAAPQNDYWIATDEFDAQMQTLRQNDYESVSMKDVYNYETYGTKLPKKPVVISFDDGCKNLYTEAYPILKKHHYIAEIYLIADAVGDIESERINSGKGGDPTKLGEMGETSITEYLIWPEIKEMADNGIEFGSHSKSHPLMSELNQVNLSHELLYSKLAIAANIGKNITSFAYPFGDGAGKKEIHNLLAKYGFTTAVAANGGILQTDSVDLLNIPRVSIYGVKPTLDPKSKGVSVVPDPARPEDLFMAKLNPDEAEKQFELSNRYTALGESDKALDAINKAVELKPNNLRYLLTRLFTAGAAENADIALDSALRAYKLDPTNDENLLRLAGAAVWANHLDDAAEYYEVYKERHPDTKEGKIEYAQVQSWRGSYASTFKILEAYKEKFGEDELYLQTKAETLTWSDRPTEAFTILRPQLQKEPNNYNTNFTNTVALYKDGEIVEALESLEKTEKISPDSKDNIFLSKYIKTDLRHYVRAGIEYSFDTDNVSVLSGELEGRYFLSPLTSIYAIARTDYVSLSNNYPIEYTQDSGALNARQDSLRAGVSHRFSSKLTGDISAGIAKAATHRDPVYGAALSYTPIDNMTIGLSYDHHYFVVTPKTIGRGTLDDSIQLNLYTEPTSSMYIDFSAGYDMLTDNYFKNSSWNLGLSPTWAVLRRQYWNFDLGLSAIGYGYEKESQFNDLGYYAPKWSQAYYATSFTTWKISDNDSVNLAINAGVFQDNNMNAFVFGGGMHLEGVFGLYRDWMIKANAGVDYSARYYDRDYSIQSAGLYITRRF